MTDPTTKVGNPAIEAFVGQLDREGVIAQLWIRRVENGFELRHVSDRGRDSSALTPVGLGELRSMAQFTQGGDFRPLKSAPTLRSGWRARVGTVDELEFAFLQIYPGAIADWFSARDSNPPVTSYRAFTKRQTGMYRVTTLLDDSAVARVIGECCNPMRCLKRRLWSNGELPADSPEAKSLIPCLEPCAILLETARVTLRREQAREDGVKSEE